MTIFRMPMTVSSKPLKRRITLRQSQFKNKRSMQDRGTLTMIRGCGTGRRRREREAALALPTVDELLDGGKK